MSAFRNSKHVWLRIATTPAGHHPQTIRSRSHHHVRGANPAGASPVNNRVGVTRSLVDAPDQCVIIPLPGNCAGRARRHRDRRYDARRATPSGRGIQREVVEYRIVSGTCACGRAQCSTFPAGIEVPVQYGPSVSAFAVYMTQYQLLPYQRTAEVLNELAGLAISPVPSSTPYGWPPPAWRCQSTRFAMHSSRRQWPMPMKPAGA